MAGDLHSTRDTVIAGIEARTAEGRRASADPERELREDLRTRRIRGR